MILVFSSCTKSKDDSVAIPPGARTVKPENYLEDPTRSKLLQTREAIFEEKAPLGERVTYAFDLYVRNGRAYRGLYSQNYHKLRCYLLSNVGVEWFFLSGGYGVMHAFEEARTYQATFDKNIAYSNKIAYTGKIWENVLESTIDGIIARYTPSKIYVFGGPSYTKFVMGTNYYKEKQMFKIFESTGSAGPTWLSPIINELAESIMKGKLEEFDRKYPDFVKQ